MFIKFQVANFKLGQIYPSKKFGKACCERFNRLITSEGVSNIFNLDKFSTCPEFDQLYVDLSNSQSFNLLCTTLKNMDNDKGIFGAINGIRLSNNKIRDLRPMSTFSKLKLRTIDLRNNNVREIKCKFIARTLIRPLHVPISR